MRPAGPPPCKAVLFWALLAIIPLAGAELLGFALAKARPDLFDQRQQFLSTLRPERFQQFRQSAASDRLGWDVPAGGTRHERNCVGEEITYTYSADRIRRHGSNPAEALIVVAGDSYTHGEEVADDATYPATLERILGVGVANLGVPGYGPDQALLKLEGLIDRLPKARIAVLSIMYENSRRMVNSYRPVYYRDTGIRFGLKPFLRDGAFHSLVGDPFRDFPTFLAAADAAFDNDFWRRPRARFPYSVASLKALLAPAFWVPSLDQLLIGLGIPQHRVFYSLPGIRADLRALYERFAAFTQARNIRPVVVFIPPYEQDRVSGLLGIAAATEAQRAQITFANVGSGFDWTRFFRGCHPSADGYAMIAADVADALRPLLTGGR